MQLRSYTERNVKVAFIDIDTQGFQSTLLCGAKEY